MHAHNKTPYFLNEPDLGPYRTATEAHQGEEALGAGAADAAAQRKGLQHRLQLPLPRLQPPECLSTSICCRSLPIVSSCTALLVSSFAPHM